MPLDVSTSEVFDLEGYDGYTDSDDQEDEHYHLVTDGMINIKDIAEELVIIEKPMRAYSEHSDQMLTEGNGWEVIDEDQLTEVQKSKIVILNKEKLIKASKLQQLYDKDQ